VNGSNASLRFEDPQLHVTTKQLSSAGQRALLRFALQHDELLAARGNSSNATVGAGGAGNASVAGISDLLASLEAAAFASAQGLFADRDDGNVDPEPESHGRRLGLVDAARSAKDEPLAEPLFFKALDASELDTTAFANANASNEAALTPHHVVRVVDQLARQITALKAWLVREEQREGHLKGYSGHGPHGRHGSGYDKDGRRKPGHGLDDWYNGGMVAGDGHGGLVSDAENKFARKCAKFEAHGCGVLHDLFAALWGEMKDLVEESTQKVVDDDTQWKKIDDGINMQLQAFASQQGELQATLAEATSNQAADSSQQVRKQAEARDMESLNRTTMTECRTTVNHILFAELCGITRVRNTLIAQNLPELKPETIADCEVGSWLPGECSMPCDNSRHLVGGTQMLTREVITRNSPEGAPCPVLTMTKKCNQVRCPINCEVSDWSTFSSCTKECGGGVQQRTRTQLVKPRHGGHACNAMIDSRPCNTGSCDRDCTLSDWKPLSECSKVCDTGYTYRRKDIVLPGKGEGACPAEDDPQRYHEEACNEQACVGDEECFSRLDLVIAIDSSGSLSEDGFSILKTFAEKVVQRLKPRAYGQEAVRVGLVMFGNGQLDDQDVVSDAIMVSPLTDDLEGVTRKIQGLKWQFGFTNMAQAFLKSSQVLGYSIRNDAENVVLLLTDGRPTFKHQTMKAVEEVKQNARIVVVQVQAYRREENVQLLKEFSSRPFEANYVHIPGKKTLMGMYEAYATKVIAEICSKAVSPSHQVVVENQYGYKKALEGSACPDEGKGVIDAPKDYMIVDSSEYCFKFAQEKVGTWVEFAYGKHTCRVFVEKCKKPYWRSDMFNTYEPVDPSTTRTTTLQPTGGREQAKNNGFTWGDFVLADTGNRYAHIAKNFRR